MTDDTVTAKELVNRLRASEMSSTEISEALGGRVSPRTIHRWGAGESSPQNATDFAALQDLVQERCPFNA